MENKVDFGFKKVEKSDKQNLVNQVFSSVANKYDLMNDLMSMGVHRLWKDHFINSFPNYNGKLIDVAGGTGDISKRFYKKATNPDITICDINENMLNKGRDNLINENIYSGIKWCCGDAQNLPFPDMSFDYYTIAFGIRNVTDINAALREAYRVLKPGGKFMCLEFSKLENTLLEKIYNAYSKKIIPIIGDKIANDRESYEYLVESIQLFPEQRKFAKMIEDSEFKMVSYENLSSGIAAIHHGWRI